MTRIEWTNRVWNPIIGCTAVSPGCANCYAAKFAHRHASNPKMGDTYHGLTVKHPNGLVGWTGNVKCLPDRLEDPLHWKKPSRIFVNSMSDLFHEDVPDEFIDDVFAVMRQAEQHTFQVLTKRPARMKAYLSNPKRSLEISKSAQDFALFQGTPHLWMVDLHRNGIPDPFPLPNVWLGVSVENQATADERIPLLLQTPAAVRWISAEPLLASVDLSPFLRSRGKGLGDRGLDWVVTGGESGPKARPCHPDWIRTLRDQCREANVEFFMKQICENGRKVPMEQWPDDLKVQEYPNATR